MKTIWSINTRSLEGIFSGRAFNPCTTEQCNRNSAIYWVTCWHWIGLANTHTSTPTLQLFTFDASHDRPPCAHYRIANVARMRNISSVTTPVSAYLFILCTVFLKHDVANSDWLTFKVLTYKKRVTTCEEENRTLKSQVTDHSTPFRCDVTACSFPLTLHCIFPVFLATTSHLFFSALCVCNNSKCQYFSSLSVYISTFFLKIDVLELFLPACRVPWQVPISGASLPPHWNAGKRHATLSWSHNQFKIPTRCCFLHFRSRVRPRILANLVLCQLLFLYMPRVTHCFVFVCLTSVFFLFSPVSSSSANHLLADARMRMRRCYNTSGSAVSWKTRCARSVQRLTSPNVG